MTLIMNKTQLAAALPEQLGAADQDMHRRLMAEDIAVIEAASFFCLATIDAKKRQTLTHAKGEPGFIIAVDDRSLLLPEEPGGGTFESMTNVLSDPLVSLLVVAPGGRDAVHIRGSASLTNDPRLLAYVTSDGHDPSLALFLEVSEVSRRAGSR